jgi:hypothetical protein
MKNTLYLKRIERYIANKSNSKKATPKSKGLLAPEKELPANKENISNDIVSQMAEFVFAIRKKRMELKNGKKNRS